MLPRYQEPPRRSNARGLAAAGAAGAAGGDAFDAIVL